jgi:hypothetical protein
MGKIKADPEEMRQLLTDEANGVAKFFEALGLPPLKVVSHVLPEEIEPPKPSPVIEKPTPEKAPAAQAPTEAPAAPDLTGGGRKV